MNTGEEAAVKIYIQPGVKLLFTVETKLSATVDELKSTIAEECGIPVEKQWLSYRIIDMMGDRTLHSLGVREKDTVHMQPYAHDAFSGPRKRRSILACFERCNDLLKRINTEDPNGEIHFDSIPEPARDEVLTILRLAYSNGD